MQRGYLVSFLQRRHHVLLDEGLLLHFHILEGLAVRTMERTLPRLRTTQNLPAQLSENVFKALDLCLQESGENVGVTSDEADIIRVVFSTLILWHKFSLRYDSIVRTT